MSEQSFLTQFEAEDIELLDSSIQAYTCPPTTPASTKVSAEGRANYATLKANTKGYGMTGLMAMNTWETTCYGQVRQGYVFLFPGTAKSKPPAYKGTVKINCVAHAPLKLTSGGQTLHKQMCDLLGRPPADFIGFALKYPWNGSGNVGYNSSTCNPYWFGGQRTIPTNCNGVNWQKIVYDTLAAWLPK